MSAAVEISLWADMFPRQETQEIQASVNQFKQDVLHRSEKLRRAAVAKGYADAAVVVTSEGMGVYHSQGQQWVASVNYAILGVVEGDKHCLDDVFAALNRQVDDAPPFGG